MPYTVIPEHEPNSDCEYLKKGHCYYCCERCNYDTHRCHFCGEGLTHTSFDYQGKRHWLSDCRPDLVEHEIGETCTWHGLDSIGNPEEPDCYAYQDDSKPGRPWTDEHKHFYKDGSMA